MDIYTEILFLIRVWFNFLVSYFPLFYEITQVVLKSQWGKLQATPKTEV